MRRVRKGTEPDCLADVRREVVRIMRETGRPLTSNDWELLKDCAGAVRDALRRDQDGLCAYCCGTLGSDGQSMKIEHFLPRSQHPERMFDWSNLLGVCLGRAKLGEQPPLTHCDTSRGDRPLHVHPVTSPRDPGELFPVNITARAGEALGSVRPTSPEAAVDVDTLNLNATHLVHNRAEEVRQLRRLLQADSSTDRLRRLLRTATEPVRGQLPAYAHVREAWLRRKLRQRERPL